MKIMKMAAWVLAFLLILTAFWGWTRLDADIRRQVPPGFHLASRGMRAGGDLRLTVTLVPDSEFRVGRSRISMRGVRVVGRLWPPLSDCEAVVEDVRVHVPALRASSAVSALFEINRLAGAVCPGVRADAGEIVIDDSPPIHLSIDRAAWDSSAGTMNVSFDRLDSQPTRLALTCERRAAGRMHIRGEWNLSGLDVTAMFARAGLTWSSRTDIGVLEFETDGDESRESGRVTVTDWVLMGIRSPRPFRLAVPSITAGVSASGGEIRLHDVRIVQPSYDLVGAKPEMFNAFFAQGPSAWLDKKKFRPPKLAVSARHESQVAALPNAFSIRIDSLRIDTGAAFMIDRPRQTQFVMRAADVTVDLSGPASYFGRTPNTSIRFRVNDKQQMRWQAITDFSTWPPQFRLTDVK